MANSIQAARSGGNVIESVIAKGDLAKLTPEERTRYYVDVCKSIGLNPFTKPFEYITLNGKLTLYARRDAADQLRKINGISIEVVSRDTEDDLLVVHVRARDATGRSDEDFGAVSIASLKGEAKANAILKAITKAKRRVTLSLSGLGFLDETEVEDIPAVRPAGTTTDLDAFASETIDVDTGEIRDISAEGWAAARAGRRAWAAFYDALTDEQYWLIKAEIADMKAAVRAGGQPAPAKPPEGEPDFIDADEASDVLTVARTGTR